jgi:hypothetical protein
MANTTKRLGKGSGASLAEMAAYGLLGENAKTRFVF